MQVEEQIEHLEREVTNINIIIFVVMIIYVDPSDFISTIATAPMFS